MAYQLTTEVYDHAPRDLTLGERAVLLVIAEGARVESRTYAIGRAELAERAGLTASGLRNVLRRLRDRGLDPRVPTGRTSTDGRPVYAVPGTVVTYRLPYLHIPALSDDLVVDEPAVDAPSPATVDNSPTAGDKGGTGCPPPIHKGGTQCRQGGHRVAARGAQSAPPPRSRGPVDAPAPGYVPARDVPAREPAPTPSSAVDAPPRCLQCCDLPPGVRGPGCRDCAELRRAWSAERTQRNRDELRRRNRCRACDELGWLLGPDGAAQSSPAVRCRHTTYAQRVAPRGPTGTAGEALKDATTRKNSENARA